jgi:hypothetical protein
VNPSKIRITKIRRGISFTRGDPPFGRRKCAVGDCMSSWICFSLDEGRTLLSGTELLRTCMMSSCMGTCVCERES